jgi:hypothetical protein
MSALEARSNWTRVRVEGEVMGRGNELCSYASKVQSHQPPKVIRHQPNTRSHELKLEYLETRLGLSGLPLPLLNPQTWP